MRQKPAFPVFLDLSEKKVVVIGGGKLAQSRVLGLVDFAGAVQVISPAITEELEKLVREGRVGWLRQEYERDRILDADLVLACTNDAKVNNDAYVACKCLGILVNNCSDEKKCDFYFPEVMHKDDLVVGIFDKEQDRNLDRELTETIKKAIESR
uniref:precorrin-2 dehydrogenase/sirohydrochlorin ferrochelatase family protein n=1 Tax=Eubacterium cellulosolvens TaxID=29322 RepID=UPI00054D62A6|nr:bifunctional precorrin-2 dehydrogenase/sirohydrochlorin ferrochelatase [[Eubacterium] cellulosolvens]